MDGCMYSGKSKFILDTIQKLQNDGVEFLLFKRNNHGRDGKNMIKSRNSDFAFECMGVSNITEILSHIKETTKAILVDEIQFFHKDETLEVLRELNNRGLDIYTAGLNVTGLSLPETAPLKFETWETTDAIRELDGVEFLEGQDAVCEVCGKQAVNMALRFIPDTEEGWIPPKDKEKELFTPTCYEHWVEITEERIAKYGPEKAVERDL